MVVEEDQPSDREDDKKEEEVDHEDVGHFVIEVGTKEVFAFVEKEESKAFNVSFVDDQQKDPIEGVLSEVY